jgi:hypothetical protein
MNPSGATRIQGQSMVYPPQWESRTALKARRLTSGGLLPKTSGVIMVKTIFLPITERMKGGCDA